jgi:hypothetical protein
MSSPSSTDRHCNVSTLKISKSRDFLNITIHCTHSLALFQTQTEIGTTPVQTPVVFTGMQKILTAPLQNDQTIALYKDIERYSAR